MSEVNQFAISQILGSEIRPVGPVRFGGFGVLQTTAEIIKAIETHKDEEDPEHFKMEQNRLVVDAFEKVRRGAATDELLWNKSLASQFVLKCRDLGLVAPHGFLVRRLINIRKSPKRYANQGISIAPATKSEKHASIVQKYAHVIEFALVRLRYRHAASIDDILANPSLGDEFESTAKEIAPELSSEELRLGALSIRKSRYVPRDDIASIRRLRSDRVENAMSRGSTLASLNPDRIPASAGLFALREGTRYIYISRNDDLKAAALQLASGRALTLISNGCWSPNPETISLYFVSGNEVDGVSLNKWQLKLLYDRSPLFNWPIHREAS